MNLWWPSRQPRPLAETAASVRDWVGSTLGGEVIEAERHALGTLLPQVFGYRLVQLGISPDLSLYEASAAGHCFVVSPGQPQPEQASGLCSEAGELALASESADILLLHHVLDFDPDPHAVLREAARVTISGGTVIVVGFNPWSLFALRRSPWGQQAPWGATFIGAGRLGDWMRLLDLHPQSLAFGFFRPPIGHTGLLQRLRWMDRAGEYLHLPLGGFYVMSARKHPVGMTPLRPKVARRGLLSPGIQPTLGETRLGVHRRNFF